MVNYHMISVICAAELSDLCVNAHKTVNCTMSGKKYGISTLLPIEHLFEFTVLYNHRKLKCLHLNVSMRACDYIQVS